MDKTLAYIIVINGLFILNACSIYFALSRISSPLWEIHKELRDIRKNSDKVHNMVEEQHLDYNHYKKLVPLQEILNEHIRKNKGV